MRNKLFNWFGASLIALFLAVAILPLQFAHAMETTSEKYAVSLTLPDRWTHRDASKDFFRVYAKDSRDQANVILTALEGKKDTSINVWMGDQVAPKSLKSYAGGNSYYSKRKESQIQLGTGAEAKVLEYDLFFNNNQHRRSLVFVYWEREGIWYWVQIYNSGWHLDIVESGLLKQIAEGIKLPNR